MPSTRPRVAGGACLPALICNSPGMDAALQFTPKPTLVGPLVVARPGVADDAEGFMEVDVQAMRLTGTHRRHSPEELRRWYGSRAEQTDRLDLAVVERATGEVAGEVVLNDLNPHNRSCGFRILLVAERFRGRGLGTDATRLVLGHAFRAVGLNRVELTVYDFNPRARHVYEKMGFRMEGTRRQALLWEGRWVDAHVMGLLASEWTVATQRPATPDASAPRDDSERRGSNADRGSPTQGRRDETGGASTSPRRRVT